MSKEKLLTIGTLTALFLLAAFSLHARAAGQEGMVVVRDPLTGKMRAPTPDERRDLRARAPSSAAFARAVDVQGHVHVGEMQALDARQPVGAFVAGLVLHRPRAGARGRDRIGVVPARVDGGIDAGAAIDHVVARPAGQAIVATLARQLVGAVGSRQHVVAVAADTHRAGRDRRHLQRTFRDVLRMRLAGHLIDDRAVAQRLGRAAGGRRPDHAAGFQIHQQGRQAARTLLLTDGVAAERDEPAIR